MPINKRKKYLIKKAFQLKYTAVILFFIFLTTIISSMAIYLAIFPYLSQKLANIYPQGRLVMILRQANMKVLISSALFLPIAAWFGLILSHRIAGPWYRMELILQNVAEGDLTRNVTLRRGDELQSLAEAINKVTSNLRDMSHENTEYLNSIDEALKTFESEINKEPIDAMNAKLLISKIQEISKDLKTSLKRHRLS